MASPPPPPPLPQQWLVVHKAPHVSADQEDVDNCFFVSRASPPILSHLQVSAAYPHTAGTPPLRVLAAGLFLLPARSDVPGGGYTVSSTSPTPPSPTPSPSPASTTPPASPSSKGGGSFMVVGIECDNLDNAEVWLHCCLHGTGGWVIKPAHNPMPHRARDLDGVIAHDSRVWWVRTASATGPAASGLLSCDPFADVPQMVFSTSPELRPFCQGVDRFRVPPPPPVARRCVQVAGGKLRWVQTLCYHMEEEEEEQDPSLLQQAGAPRILVLTLDHPTAEWRRSDGYHRLSFADVWASDSYLASSLPAEEPALAFLDPTDPSIIYFSLNLNFFAVDMRAKEALEGSHHHYHGMPDVSSSSLLPWVLPAALITPPGSPQPHDQDYHQEQAPPVAGRRQRHLRSPRRFRYQRRADLPSCRPSHRSSSDQGGDSPAPAPGCRPGRPEPPPSPSPADGDAPGVEGDADQKASRRRQHLHHHTAPPRPIR
ncbi:hypothetical protein BS78_10G252700 [Paspalum vaginatum]|nr:hypothetical protein BS78_10G252700 [Paspalum vaginatum]